MSKRIAACSDVLMHRRGYVYIPKGGSVAPQPLNLGLGSSAKTTAKVEEDRSGSHRAFEQERQLFNKSCGMQHGADPTRASMDHYQFTMPKDQAEDDTTSKASANSASSRTASELSLFSRLREAIVCRFARTKGTAEFTKMAVNPAEQQDATGDWITWIELNTLLRAGSGITGKIRFAGKTFTDHANPDIRALHPRQSAAASKAYYQPGSAKGTMGYQIVLFSMCSAGCILMMWLSGTLFSDRRKRVAALESYGEEIKAKGEQSLARLKETDELIARMRKQSGDTIEFVESVRAKSSAALRIGE